jgi:hypothetical protein
MKKPLNLIYILLLFIVPNISYSKTVTCLLDQHFKYHDQDKWVDQSVPYQMNILKNQLELKILDNVKSERIFNIIDENENYIVSFENKPSPSNKKIPWTTFLTYEKNNGKTSFMSYNNAGFTINYGVCK